ncbi:MAG: metal ABC transporter permease [Candidatus Omnitrophota bacterium]
MNNLFLSIFNQPALWNGLAAAVITAGVCSYLGVFIVLKRIVFVSVALAEVAGLGIALGFFLGINYQLSAFLLTLLAILFFWHHGEHLRTHQESLVGVIYCLAAAFGVILIAKNPLAHAHGLDIVSGNFLYASRQEIMVLGFVAGVVMVIQCFFRKEFLSVSFDADFARSTGINARLWNFLFYLSVGFVISLSLKMSGLIFVFGSLLIPAMAGLVTGGRIEKIFLISVTFAVLLALVGFILSYYFDLPSAPAIVSLYGVTFFLINLIRKFLPTPKWMKENEN